MLKEQDQKFLQEKLDFWDRISGREQAALIENTMLVSYRRGHNIYSAVRECIGVLLIKSGEIRCHMLSDEGRDITLYRLGPGEVCILSASCLLKNITFDVSIDAEKDSEVLLINAAVFARLMEENVYVENFSLQVAVDKFSEVMWAMEQLLFMSFDKRLAIFLLDEMNKSGTDSIRLTHEQIARYVGSAREVVSRMLKHFAGGGIVELSRGGIRIIDREKLKEMTL